MLVAAIFALVTTMPAHAEHSRWAMSPAGCSGELETRAETPLILDRGELRWFDLACRVVSSYKVKDASYLQVECRRGETRSEVPVMLEPAGTRMRVGWNREPVREMRLCRFADGIWRQ